MSILEILGTAFGIGLLAGIRLYATVLAVGLGVRWGIFELSPELEQLKVLAETPVLALAGAAYLIEFFADKIPWLDSAWDALHTFIRPLGAALLGAAAFGSLDPKARVLLAILCGGVALAGHGSKAATRLVINQSPEPFSNAAVSVAEDAIVPPAVWFVMAFPVATLVIVGCFLALFLWLAPKLFRLIRAQLAAAGQLARRMFGPSKGSAN